MTDKRSPTVSPAGAGQKDPMSALVDQLHGGVQLRPTARGNFIRNSAGQQSVSPFCFAFIAVANYQNV